MSQNHITNNPSDNHLNTPESQNHQGNIYFQQGELEKAAVCYHRAITLNPDYHRAYNNLGNVYFEQGNLEAAEKYFQQALTLKPDYFGTCYNLGLVYARQNNISAAISFYQRAITLKPDYCQTHNNLGSVYLHQDQLNEAKACFQKALTLNPRHYEAWNNMGNVCFYQGMLDDAATCYQKALSLNPEPLLKTRIHMHQGLLFLLMGKYAEGWQKYESRYDLPEFSYLKKIHPLWDGSVLTDKTLLVRYEQGIGDTLQFVRYLPMARKQCSRLIFLCQPNLKTLLENAAGIDQLVVGNIADVQYDAAIGLMSLPRIFNTDIETIPNDIPYIYADEKNILKFKNNISFANDKSQIPNDLNIGLVWQGNPKYKHDKKRSLSLSDFKPLADIPHIIFHSLQVGKQAKAALHPPENMCVYDWSDQLNDFADTAGLMANLDLIISVDTAAAHLAGAMGKPVWTLLPFVPDWRWMTDREDSPWYPTMRLFRQSEPGNWKPVIEKMALELKSFAIGNLSFANDKSQMTNHRLKQCRYGVMLYPQNNTYISKSLDLYGEYSEGEAALFRQFINPGDVIVEAGSNIGAHTVFLSKLTGQNGKIFAYEPQRIIFQILCANAALNELTNIYARQSALDEISGSMEILTPDRETVPLETIDDLKLDHLRFIKANAGGMEIQVLQGASETIRRLRPVLYVSNNRREKSASLITFIQKSGYRIWWYLPRLFNPDNFAGRRDNVFGNAVFVNLLCIPKEAQTNITGLKEVTSADEVCCQIKS